MSATSDKNQKHTFVYSNLYHLYKKGKEAAKNGMVLKTGDVARENFVTIREYEPVELVGKKIGSPVSAPIEVKSVLEAPGRPNPAIEQLKSNLKDLNELHSRLRFMLKELEDIVKE